MKKRFVVLNEVFEGKKINAKDGIPTKRIDSP